MANNVVQEQGIGTGEELLTAKFTKKIMDILNKEPSHANTTIANPSETSGITCLSILGNDDWIIDSGASDHMCFSLDKFHSYNFISDKGHMITVPDVERLKSSTWGQYNCKMVSSFSMFYMCHNLDSI